MSFSLISKKPMTVGIHRENILKILKKFHFSNKLINLIMISVMETNVKVKVGGLISDPVQVKSELR